MSILWSGTTTTMAALCRQDDVEAARQSRGIAWRRWLRRVLAWAERFGGRV